MSMLRPYELGRNRHRRARRIGSGPMQIDAVIFDWGGTLTRWHDIDFHAESLALAHAVVASHDQLEVHAEALHRANQAVWGRSRDHQQSSTVADLFTEAGLEHDPELL